MSDDVWCILHVASLISNSWNMMDSPFWNAYNIGYIGHGIGIWEGHMGHCTCILTGYMGHCTGRFVGHMGHFMGLFCPCGYYLKSILIMPLYSWNIADAYIKSSARSNLVSFDGLNNFVIIQNQVHEIPVFYATWSLFKDHLWQNLLNKPCTF